ncbi:hypothetical protein H9Y05_01835 [Crocinitomicaceae bacterium CZZ-1]|uniref:Lipoprotein n=1 Tax=Taishania pollutisoli TaxID=2766479 RepID=A0A8J6PH01_9FLAO|nr:hypothetical protein [Taishania pollutisoli]MBC9811204.1 hypothetical protein [Taishania pollutisoli]
MKKVILGTLFLGSIGLGILGCKKEGIQNKQDNDSSQIRSDIQKIFNTHSKDENYHVKSDEVSIENRDNPLDNVGYMHNEVLRFIMSPDINRTIICTKIPEVNRAFKVNVSNDCDKLFRLCEIGVAESFDNEGNFQSNVLRTLLEENKIQENEFQIVSTTFLYTNDMKFNDKINFIKAVEKYTIQSSDLNSEQKNRVLRTFAIYRYSSHYWENENPQPNAMGPISAFADACAEYWALNSPDSPAQDGKDVYAIAGLVSAVVHVLTGF